MTIQEQIRHYIDQQPVQKRADLTVLHEQILQVCSGCKLWFLDGKDERGKIVSNPNIGYGSLKINYADGNSRDFYQIGLSANTKGISVYIMGLGDKKFLLDTYGNTIGKARVSGYCISFSKLEDINIDVLFTAIRAGIAMSV